MIWYVSKELLWILSEEISDHAKPLLISAAHLYGMSTHEVLGILMVNIDTVELSELLEVLIMLKQSGYFLAIGINMQWWILGIFDHIMQ